MTVETILFKADERSPNNPLLPVLIYRQAIAGNADAADAFGTRFRLNGWQGIWQNGIFDYHHYHVGAHEVLGIAAGRARLLIGGEGGEEITVHAGDCLVLPAGTGHKRLDASRDLVVIGAYPPGQTADITTGPADDRQRQEIAALALPKSDPLEGPNGPLMRLWA
jgi:uncharacterized protein YjlB